MEVVCGHEVLTLDRSRVCACPDRGAHTGHVDMWSVCSAIACLARDISSTHLRPTLFPQSLVFPCSQSPHVSTLFSSMPVSTRRTPARDEPARSSAAALPSTEPARGFAAPLPALSPGSQSSPVTHPLGPCPVGHSPVFPSISIFLPPGPAPAFFQNILSMG